MHDTADELASFADLLASLSRASGPVARPGYELENALVRLGFKPSPGVVGLLRSMHIHRVAPLHLDLARKFAADPVALRRMQGVPLNESLLDLMGFEHMRLLLTRRFFKTYRPRSEQEEPLWWAAEHLERALQVSCINVRRIDSARQLLREGERATNALGLAGISLRPQ